MVETPEPRHGGPGGRGRGPRRPLRRHPAAHGDRPRARARRRSRHARAGQRRRRHLVEGLDQLRPPRLAQLRLPRRPRGAARAARRLQQRRQRGGALRPLSRLLRPDRPASTRRSPPSSAPGSAAASIEEGRIVKGAAGMAGELGHVHIPMQGLLGEGQPLPEVQLRLRGRRRERRLADRHREEPAALLAHPVSRARAGPRRLDRQGRQAGARATASRATRWRGASSSSRPWPSAGCSPSPPTSPTPSAYFVGGGVVEAAPRVPRVVPGQGARAHDPARGAGRASRASRSSPTSTWPAPAARRSPRSSTPRGSSHSANA